MKKTMASAPDNMLKDIHSKLMTLPNHFKEKIGDECLWSIPTYYRKMRKEGPLYLLSNAEKEKIITVLDESLAELHAYFQKYRKG